jgi:hypothetical protein
VIQDAGVQGIYAAQDAGTGERIVGVEVLPTRFRALVDAIRGGQSAVTPRQVWRDMLANGTPYQLAYGVRLTLGRVGRNPVIQVQPGASAARLQALGVRYERGVVPVYYIPSGEETGFDVLRRVLEEFPVEPGRGSQQIEFKGDEEPGHNPLESRVKKSRSAPSEYRTAHESMEDADAALWTPEAAHPAVLLNKTAAEFLRTVMGGPTFHGFFLTQQEALELARSADRQRKLVQYVNFVRAQESIHRIAAILRAAARGGDVTAVVIENRSEEAVTRTLVHERFHLFQNSLPGGIAEREFGVRFLSNPAARRGADTIVQRVGLRAGQVWHEVPAYIASGKVRLSVTARTKLSRCSSTTWTSFARGMGRMLLTPRLPQPMLVSGRRSMEINTNPKDRTDLPLADPKAAEDFQAFRRRERECRASELAGRKTTDSAPEQPPTKPK